MKERVLTKPEQINWGQIVKSMIFWVQASSSHKILYIFPIHGHTFQGFKSILETLTCGVLVSQLPLSLSPAKALICGVF